MKNDTRDKNKYFNLEEGYFEEYIEELHTSLSMVDQNEVDNAIRAIEFNRINGGRIFVAGNGGSSAIAEHLTCDMEKGCHVKTKSIATHCLSSNTALMTAIANDMGYEYTFSYQLETQGMKCEDTLILISSSGNSPNIVKAAEYANFVGSCVIGLTGFEGGLLNEIADVKLHVPASNYGIVEDAHQAIMHIMAQIIYLEAR